MDAFPQPCRVRTAIAVLYRCGVRNYGRASLYSPVLRAVIRSHPLALHPSNRGIDSGAAEPDRVKRASKVMMNSQMGVHMSLAKWYIHPLRAPYQPEAIITPHTSCCQPIITVQPENAVQAKAGKALADSAPRPSPPKISMIDRPIHLLSSQSLHNIADRL